MMGGGQECRAAVSFAVGESDGDQVETGVWEQDAAAGGELDSKAGGVGSGSVDDDAGARCLGVGCHDVQQLVHGWGVGVGGVDEQDASIPDVGAGHVRAGGDDVVVVVGGAVDGV